MKPLWLLGPFGILAVWSVVAFFSDPFFLPGPLTVLPVLLGLLNQSSILVDIWSTAQRTFAAFAIAALVGVPLGLVCGMYPKFFECVEFAVDFFRSTPATALFPLFMLWLGIGSASKIGVAAFSSCLVVLFNVAQGLLYAEKSRVMAARLMGASQTKILVSITFWESLPSIIIGLRNAVSISLIVILVTEMFIGTSSGIGRRIIDFQTIYRIPEMYAMIVIVGIMGYALNVFFSEAENRLVHWHHHV